MSTLRDETLPLETPTGGGVAIPVGDAFHRMLESWDLEAPPDQELRRQREKQLRWLHSEVSVQAMGAARDRFESLLERFRSGQFWDRFLSLRGQPVAREVPVLLPAEDADSGPVGYVSGFVDLLYRDPHTSRWVIVDYKTDRLESGSEIEKRIRLYSLQEAVYARAIREALDLEYAPATQLWFIWPAYVWEETADP